MDLWLAKSATDWRTTYKALDVGREDRVALRHLLTTPEAALALPALVDALRARSLLLSGLAGQVWELKQQILAINSEDSSAALWSRSRRSEL